MRLSITSNYMTVVRLQSVYSRVGMKVEIYPSSFISKNKPNVHTFVPSLLGLTF